MIKILDEKQQLDEMAIRVISSRSDGLPFRITIQSPDHTDKPHAHLKDLETGKKELGQFEITRRPPRSLEDIKNYKQEIPVEWRELIFTWLNKPHKALPEISNWKALYLDWLRNEKW